MRICKTDKYYFLDMTYFLDMSITIYFSKVLAKQTDKQSSS